MRIRTIVVALVVVAGLGVLLLAAGYAVLHGMDLNAYRSQVITKVKAFTGRELRLEGDLGIGLQDGLLIRADRLALGNAPWGSRPEMVTVGHAEAHLALLPLLLGEVQVRRIELHDVDLLLERDAAGQGNWELGQHSAPDSHAGGGMPAIRIESGQVAWHPVARADAEALVFTDLQFDAGLRGDHFHLRGSAKLKGETFDVNGHLPTRFALAGGRAQDLDLRLELGRMAVQARGTLQQASWGLAPDLQLKVEQIDLASVGHLAGWMLPAMPPVTLGFDVTRSSDAWQIAKLEVKAGRSALTGEWAVTVGKGRPKLAGQLTAGRLDLTELVPLATDRKDAGKAAEPVARDVWRQLLTGFDATVQLRIARLVTGDVDLLDLQISGQLTDGRLRLRPIKTGLADGGRAAGHFELNAGTGRPNWRLAFQLQDVPAGVLLGRTRASLIDAPLNLDLDLTTAGRSAEEAIANLAGDARLVVGKGRARMKSIDSLVGGLSTLTGQLLARGSDDAQLNCAVADFEIQRGVAKADVLLIDSAVSTVRGDGQIDLGARHVDLTFTPRAKTPTLNVAVPVHVRGPWAQPQFSADRMATLGKLIGVAGLFVYPPAALVTLGELGGSGNACLELMRGGAVADDGGSAAGKVQQGVGDAVKGIGSGIKKLFGQ